MTAGTQRQDPGTAEPTPHTARLTWRLRPFAVGGSAPWGLYWLLWTATFTAAAFAPLTPSTHALSLMDHGVGEDGATWARLALDDGGLDAKVLDGWANANGTPLGARFQTLDVEPGPWRGFPATVLVGLTGNGSVMLADDASGLVFRVRGGDAPEPTTGTPASRTSSSARGGAADPGGDADAGSQHPPPTAGSARRALSWDDISNGTEGAGTADDDAGAPGVTAGTMTRIATLVVVAVAAVGVLVWPGHRNH